MANLCQEVLNPLGSLHVGFYPGGRGGVLLPYKRLMGMCHWMGSHFHDNGVAVSRELLEWVAYFRIFGGKTVLHISN